MRDTQQAKHSNVISLRRGVKTLTSTKLMCMQNCHSEVEVRVASVPAVGPFSET
jgi:hypothetical protein